MSCPEFADLIDLYAFGALEGEERDAVVAHLRGGCASCRREAARARRDFGHFALAAPPALPSPRVRERLLASLPPKSTSGPRRSSTALPLAAARFSLAWAVAAAALVAAIVGFGLYLSNRAAIEDLRNELERSQGQLARVDGYRELMSRPTTRSLTLLSTAEPKSKRASALVDTATGDTLLVSSDLPPLASGRTFQLWYLGAGPAPVSGGTFDSAAAAIGYRHRGPAGLPDLVALALTDEPAGGSPGPTTTPFAVSAQ